MFRTFFSYGFRPFFLSIPILAIVAILLWISHLMGHGLVPLPELANIWHAHEMLFGLVTAAVAGFILTAITNWTGCKPLQGGWLAGLFLAWLAGRIALLMADHVPLFLLLAIILLFHLGLTGFIARQLIRAGNKRNFVFIALLLSLAALDSLMVAAVKGKYDFSSGQEMSLALDVVLLMIALVGGRITPAFTRNWLQRRGETVAMPVGTRLDMIAILSLVIMLVTELILPGSLVLASAALLAALFQSIRLVRWHGHRTLSDPLMWSLHLGFTWVAAALWLKGIGGFWDYVGANSWYHAAGIGAAGSMIVAVMSRATLGHTNRPLSAPGGMSLCYLSFTIGAVCRVLTDTDAPLPYDLLIAATGVFWILGFTIFLFHYGPMLIRKSAP